MHTPHQEERIQLGNGPIPTVKVFKCMACVFGSEEGSETELNNKEKAGCVKSMEMIGVTCDKKMSIKLKDKIYKTMVKPAMIHESECWAVKTNNTHKLYIISYENAEMG